MSWSSAPGLMSRSSLGVGAANAGAVANASAASAMAHINPDRFKISDPLLGFEIQPLTPQGTLTSEFAPFAGPGGLIAPRRVTRNHRTTSPLRDPLRRSIARRL